jgi:5,10-methylenetetrahydromethanopterin reductase
MSEQGFELGLCIDGFTPAADIAAQARAAEKGGAEALWIATHLFLRDPVALATTALAATKTLKIALMAISPYAMHPVHAAMAAATLDELYPGRVILSLGAGAPADLAAAGIERARPLATLREAIEICRALFSGEAADHHGEIFRVTERRLANARRDIPIVLAASGPKMLQLAGSHADGVIISGATSAPFVRWCLDHVERGAQGRRVKTYGIVYTRIDDDRRAAIDPVRRTLGFILRGEHHAMNVEMGGAALNQVALRDAYAREDWDGVEKLATDQVAASHAACGDAPYVRRRLAEYHAAGLDQIILNGLLQPAEIVDTLELLDQKSR